jgi:hypothetical protein
VVAALSLVLFTLGTAKAAPEGAAVQDRFADVNGVRLHYLTAGEKRHRTG